MTRLGDHAIVCGSILLRDALFQSAASANLALGMEEQALLPGNINKPANVFIPHWTVGEREGIVFLTITIETLGGY